MKDSLAPNVLASPLSRTSNAKTMLATRLVRILARAYLKLPVQPLRRPLRKLLHLYSIHLGGQRIVAQVQGILYELDLREQIDRSIYFYGAFEQATGLALARLVRPGMTVIDIGANVGCHACPLAKLVDPGKVVAFEPMPWARRKLRRNLELNGFTNVVVEELALSDAELPAQSVHFRSSWRVGRPGESDHEDPSSRPLVEVGFATLDSYVKGHNLHSIDVIKLDVDGYELKVLRGAIETLQRFNPVIVLELGWFTLSSVGDSLPDLVRFLSSLGYIIHEEKTFLPFRDEASLLARVPKGDTINVVCSKRPFTR